MTEHIPPPDPRPPIGEEIANSVSHGVGLLATLVAGPLLIVQAVGNDKPWGVIGASVFVAATIALYLASTLYHALPPGPCQTRFACTRTLYDLCAHRWDLHSGHTGCD